MPLRYNTEIISKNEFLGIFYMLLYQPQEGYCYNSDSVFLYDFISSFKPSGRVLDVGAGCGIVGLLVARDNKKIQLEAVEKQDLFVEYATINARVNNIEYKIHKKDFLDLDEDEKYDYIISNPPFYHDGVTKSENEMLFNARYPFSLGLISGALNFIPIVGPLIAGGLITMVVALDSVLKAVFVALAFLLIQQIEGSILTPFLTKKFIGLSPTIVLIALAIGAELWGVVGAVLAIPIAGILFEVIRESLRAGRKGNT